MKIRLRGNKLLRRLDRYGGIPIVGALSLLRRKRAMPANPRRIGLMKSTSLGDLVLMSGIVHDLHARFPDATLVLITGEDNQALAPLMLRDGDEHVAISPLRIGEAIGKLRHKKLDILLDFGAWVRFDAVLSALSGAKFTVGFNTPGQSRHHAYDRAVPYSGAMHEIENNQRLLPEIGASSQSMPSLRVPGVLPQAKRPSGPYAVIHPWAFGFMSHVREWADDRWISLAQYLNARGWQVMITGSPTDAPRSALLAASMKSAGVDVSDVAGTLSIHEVVDLLAEAKVAICVNTGVMHVAAAVGTPTIGLQGPTSSVRWKPLGRSTLAVDTRIPGCGYLNLGFEYEGQRLDCMEGIPVSDVVAAIDELTGIR